MFQKVLAAVLCAGLVVPTAAQPLTVTAFADDTAVESAAESNTTEENVSGEAVTDEATVGQTGEAAESTETKADEVWDDQNNPNLKIYLTEYISLLDFLKKVDGLYDGAWNVHVYAKLRDGTMEFINSMQFTKEKSNMYNMYRLYNPNSSEHFFTGSVAERDQLVAAGWKYEGIAWCAPEYGDDVYRLYNPNSGEHHYTMDRGERTRLVQLGWKYEGIAWLSDRYVGTPLYRLYNPNNGGSAGAHHYTASADERDYLVSLGWRYEAIGWYGVHHEKKTGA